MIRSFGFLFVLLGTALVLLGVRAPGVSGSLIEWVRVPGNLRVTLVCLGGLLVACCGIAYVSIRLALRIGFGLLVLERDAPVER